MPSKAVGASLELRIPYHSGLDDDVANFFSQRGIKLKALPFIHSTKWQRVLDRGPLIANGAPYHTLLSQNVALKMVF